MSLLDLIDPNLLTAKREPAVPEGEFSKGLRSGTLGLRSGFNNAVGAIEQAAGFDDFARGRFESADELAARAAEAAPRVTSHRDVHSIRDAVDYGAGLLGGAVPAIGTGLAAGALAPAGVAGAIGAGTAAFALPEMGDVVARQRAAGQPIDVGDAALSGVGSSALQSIVPGMAGARVAGKLVPKGPVSLRRAGAQVAEDVALNAGASGGGEAVKQAGAGLPASGFDLGAVEDAAVAGGVAGGGMGAIGAAGSYAHGRAGEVSKGVQAAKNAATGLLDRAAGKAKQGAEAASDAAEAAKPLAASAADSLRDLYDGGKASAQETLRKVADSEDIIGDVRAFAGAQGDKLKALLQADDDGRIAHVRRWGEELAGRALSPENKARLQQAMGNIGDHTEQAWVATQHLASKAHDHFEAGVTKLHDWLASKKGPEGAKKSEDYGGIREGLLNEVMPALLKARPELAEGTMKPEVRDALSGSMIKLVDELSRGERPSADTVAMMIDVFGPGAADVMESAHRAIGTSENPKQTQAFYQGLMTLRKAQDNAEGVLSVMRKSLRPELQKALPDYELRQELDMLRKWASDTTSRKDNAELAYKDERVRAGLKHRYGDQADTVLAAVEQARRRERLAMDRDTVETDEEGNILSRSRMIDEERDFPDGMPVLYGAGEKGAMLYKHPDFEITKGGFAPAAARRRDKLNAGRTHDPVHWVPAEKLGDEHAAVQDMMSRLEVIGETQGFDGPTYARQEIKKYGMWGRERGKSVHDLSEADLKLMSFDRHNFDAKDSPSALRTGVMGENGKTEVVLDAMKMQRHMAALLKEAHEGVSPSDEASRVLHMGRAFFDAAAAAQVHLGKAFDVPGSTVIGVLGGKKITLDRVKQVAEHFRRTDDDKEADGLTRALADAEKEFKETKSASRRQMLSEDIEKLSKIAEERRTADLSQGDDGTNGREGYDPTGFGGEVERGLSRRLTHSRQGRETMQGEVVPDRLGDSERPATRTAREKRLDELRGDYSVLVENMMNGTATDAERIKARAISNEIKELEKARPQPMGTGRREIDPFGPTHDALRGSERGSPINTDDSGGMERQTGQALTRRVNPPGEALPADHPNAAKRDPFADDAPRRIGDGIEVSIKDGEVTASGSRKPLGMAGLKELKAAAGEAARAFARPDVDSDVIGFRHEGKDYFVRQIRPGQWEIEDGKHNTLYSIASDKAGGLPANVRAAVDRMTSEESFGALKTRAQVDNFLAAAKQRYAELKAEDQRVLNDDNHPTGRLPDTQMRALAKLEDMFGPKATADLKSFYDGVEEPPGPKAVAAKKAALKEAATSGDPALLRELRSSDDAKGLQRAVEELTALPRSEGVDKAVEAANARLGELVRGDESVGYGLQTERYSMESTQPGSTGPVNRAEVKDYLDRVLGPLVKREWSKIPHAGEFERVGTEDIIRLSVHSLNPLSAAYHESLHAFFAKLGDMKQGKIMEVLNRAAESGSVMGQLRNLLRGESAALAQLSNREERAAYMYQFWAAGKLTVGPETKTMLHRIADFVRSVLGIWSNDQRALHIMGYFHRGEFAKDMKSPTPRDVVARKLLEPGTNKIVEHAKTMTSSLRDMGEALAVAGGQRLRDTGIPALRELADTMKLHGTAEGGDAGFVPAARAERTRLLNELGVKLKSYSKDSINAALESLQSKSNTAIDAMSDPADRANARLAKREVRAALDKVFDYMRAAGVKVNDLGYGKDYFPRVYDTSYISSHTDEFRTVLQKHKVDNPDNVISKLMVSEGNEFTVETDKPGMQHLKPRVLAHIPDAELAPFMRKNLFEVMNSYVTQAARRAEWARRFMDDGSKIGDLMARAKREGATQEHLDAAQKFVRSVDGTLGDTINPEARRLMGNMIVYQNIRLLPLAIFSSVVDPLGIAVRGGTVGDAWKAFTRGMSEMKKNFQKNPQDDAATQLAATLGVIDDASLVHALGALYSQGMVGDTGRKINDTFFRFNLMEQFNTSMRVSATEAALGFMKRHAAGNASPHSARWLAELGLKPGDVKLGADGRVLLSEAEGLTLEQAAKMKMAVNRWVDGAVLRPDAVDKPIWMSDPHFVLVAHLKQFVFSFHETILKRVAHELDHGNYAPAMALASYVPVMMASDFLKGFIQGGGSQPEWKREWELSDYIEAGIERGGLYGTGQFAIDALKDVRQGGVGVGALAGPTIEQLAEAVRAMGGRESYSHFALKSMPANALYAAYVGGEATDPKFVD